MSLFCEKGDLQNESDVEQKLILPLITSPAPLGLGFAVSDFRTKPDLRQVVIGKGDAAKLYYPDYVIILHGLPLMMIEAKRPDENLDVALREARLYATEINARFPHNINPCQKIIVTNGSRIIAGPWDSSSAEVDISFDDIYIENTAFASLVAFASKETLSRFSEQLYQGIRGNTIFVKPTRILGGKTVQNEELEPNSFGTSFSLEYRHLFNPHTAEDRVDIVKNTYVASKKRLKHVEPIDKIIRAANPPSVTCTQAIADTSNPKELIDKLGRKKGSSSEILLLVGSVGSGKSTFVDFVREVALPDEIKKCTVWVRLDLNMAPLSKEIIYDWLLEQLIIGLKDNFENIDFDDYKYISKIYAVEINKFAKGPGALFDKQSEDYNKLLASLIIDLQNNQGATLRALIRYLCAERGNSLIIVLDNCDKRKRDDQLLMFDVAKWLQNQYECLVFLPIRDTTFDHHRKEPPLDTAIKDMVFRIDPPRLDEVINKRVRHAISKIEQKKDDLLHYFLPNGMRVEYPRSELGLYVSCLLRSIFQDAFIRSLIIGIAGRDIRKGLELFLDILKSGYISSAEVLKIRQSHGNHLLEKYIIMRLLLRGNRKYYNDASSNIKNLFYSLPENTMPDPFVRLSILQWLANRYRVVGPNGILGYHKISQLISNLTPLGHTAECIKREIENLAKADCIRTESQDVTLFDEEDLIIISPSGHAHLELLNNIDYLSACAEDVWYRDNEVATRISQRMSGQVGHGHLSKESNRDNAYDLINYLVKYLAVLISGPDIYLANDKYDDLYKFMTMREKLQNLKQQTTFDAEYEKLISEYPSGAIVDAEIVSKQPYGLFAQFGLGGVGFIRISLRDGVLFEEIEEGDIVPCEIINFNVKHSRFTLKVRN